MTTTTFETQMISLNISASINVNPWQDTNLPPISLQSQTKHIYKKYVNNNYQHDSSILLSNTDSTTNKHNILTINRQHYHKIIKNLRNRAINSGVWLKSNFVSRLRSPQRKQSSKFNRQHSLSQDI